MRHAKPVRLETAPTGGESVHLFLDSTIVLRRRNLRIPTLVHISNNLTKTARNATIVHVLIYWKTIILRYHNEGEN